MHKELVSIDIAIPAYNEAESLEELADKIHQVFQTLDQYKYRIFFVDDGSTDNTWKIIQKIQNKSPEVVLGIRLRGNMGKAFALNACFRESKADLIMTMDADLQDNPAEIPRLLEKLDEGYGLVSGWKKRRNDPIGKVLPSRVFNFIVSKVAKIKLNDVNCGFKVYKGDLARNIHLYGELHRFTPLIAHSLGYKVGEIPVEHFPRKFGQSKYGLERFARGIIDLISVTAFTRFSDKPGHLLGGAGLMSGFFGSGILLYLGFVRIILGENIGHRPLLTLGVLLMILSVQLLSLGILAELILRKGQAKVSTQSYIDERTS
jgi:glycosyltransferase involved in cell wall biosynthesis